MRMADLRISITTSEGSGRLGLVGSDSVASRSHNSGIRPCLVLAR